MSICTSGRGFTVDDLFTVCSSVTNLIFFFFYYSSLYFLSSTYDNQKWKKKKQPSNTHCYSCLYQSYQYESVPYYKTFFLASWSSDTDCPNLLGDTLLERVTHKHQYSKATFQKTYMQNCQYWLLNRPVSKFHYYCNAHITVYLQIQVFANCSASPFRLWNRINFTLAMQHYQKLNLLQNCGMYSSLIFL